MKTTNKMKTIKLLAVLFISALAFTACSEDDHDHDDDHDHSEEEVITTLTYTLTSGSGTVTLVYDDPDGEGSAPGTYDIQGQLMASTTYTGVIKLENKTEDPAEDVTPEIIAEGDEHELFYSDTLGFTVTKTDTDGTNPIGIETTLVTGAAGSGTLTIVLKHEPTKPNDGTATGAGGSTDIEVTFDVTVQ